MARLGLVQLGMVEDGGATRAKRLADIYIKTHSNAEGKVTDPAVYQAAIDQYLAPFADDLTVASKMATFQNKVKDLGTDNSDINVSLEDLKLREHSAWYIGEDEADSTSFRNPAYVAQVTSESLDMLVAETVATIQAKQANGKDTSEIENYLRDLIKRSDRMRTLSQNLEDGAEQSLDGYGYYVDADPNTGAVRGAALMPADVGIKSIGDGSVRTDTYVQVGSKRVPLYLPYLKDETGATHINFAGKEYTGDTSLLSANDNSDVILNNREAIPFDGEEFSRGKVYRAYNGKSNIDGSPKQDMYFVGYDNKMYKFADDDPKGQAFLNSLKTTGGLNTSSIPRINPYTAAILNASPLPTDDGSFQKGQTMNAQLSNPALLDIANKEKPPATTFFGKLGEQFNRVRELGTPPPGKVVSGVGTGEQFFARRNRPSTPNAAPARTAADIVAEGRSFFSTPTTP